MALEDFDSDQLSEFIPEGLSEPNNPKDLVKAQKSVERLENQAKRLKNERYSQDTDHRRRLSWWAAVLVTLWLGGVFVLLFLNDSTARLDNSVLITLLGTTTVNVLGLMYIVLRDLFNNGKEP